MKNTWGEGISEGESDKGHRVPRWGLLRESNGEWVGKVKKKACERHQGKGKERYTYDNIPNSRRNPWGQHNPLQKIERTVGDRTRESQGKGCGGESKN